MILLKGAYRTKRLSVRSMPCYHLGVIEGREEFKDLDLVFPWNAPHMIKRAEHHTVRPFYVRHNDEEIRVTLKSIATHFKREHPLCINFQRYIVGRPNLLTLPIYPV
jgi:hypothetical protein